MTDAKDRMIANLRRRLSESQYECMRLYETARAENNRLWSEVMFWAKKYRYIRNKLNIVRDVAVDIPDDPPRPRR